MVEADAILALSVEDVKRECTRYGGGAGGKILNFANVTTEVKGDCLVLGDECIDSSLSVLYTEYQY